MNPLIILNVSINTSSQKLARVLKEHGILDAEYITDFMNNSYSKTVFIQVAAWHNTKDAKEILKNLEHHGETNIGTSEGIFIAKKTQMEEVAPEEEDLYMEADPKCEELDAYLEQMRVEDECVWMVNYDKVSLEDEMNREESYLYSNLYDLIEGTVSV
jgi:hypothetical protein